MCGITIHNTHSMLNKINHRGLPGQTGQHTYRGISQKYLYHVRLPIQTIENDNWNQPIHTSNFKFLYNGEIFNYPEKYANDVEYLLDFFNKYDSYSLIISPEAISEINTWDGFWAIVLVFRNYTVVMTDPLGKKQLYYDDHYNISSEVKGLVTPKHIFDEKTISTIIKFGYNTDDKTCFEGIRRFKPNTIYSIGNNEGHKSNIGINEYNQYYNLFTKPTFDPTTLKQSIEESVIRRCLTKKYPISLLLSGGLDSTIILSILKKHGYNVNLYSIDNSEEEYVRECEKYYGCEVKYLSFNKDADSETLYYNDSPIDLGSLYPQHQILGAVNERIVLTGDGADELFGGYTRINSYDSQLSDIFDELTYYHLPRLDRASMRYTIEMRNPFLGHDVVRQALNIPYSERKNKKVLKEIFFNQIPEKILNRKKHPLKSNAIINDPLGERIKTVIKFKEIWSNEKYR